MLASAAAALLASDAPAAEPSSPFVSGKAEAWVGSDVIRHAWSLYSGFTWSPLGKLHEDGLRVRMTGGYGEYRYDGYIDGTAQSVYGTATFADLLVGYQMGLGALTLKVFAGGSFDGHFLDPFDPSNKVNRSASGGKVVIESWLNLTDKAWAQLDLSGSTAHDSYSSRLRLGYRVVGDLSLGVEGGAFGNAASDSVRAGAFVRYAWSAGEVSLSGGVSGDIAASRNPYGTLVYLTRF